MSSTALLVAVIVTFVIPLARWTYYKLALEATQKIAGKQFLVTGACGGLGALLCKELAMKGADTIVLWDTREQTLAELKQQLTEINPTVKVITQKVNLLETQQIRVACKTLFEMPEVSIDVLVNNAGITFCGWINELTEEQDENLIRVNYLSQVEMAKMFVPHFERRRDGHIVSVVSLASYAGGVGIVQYCASKFALRGFMEGLAAELIARGSPVTVSVYCPGLFSSKLFEGFENPLPLVPTLTCEQVATQCVYDCIERRYQISLYPTYLAPVAFVAAFMNLFGFQLIVPIHTTKNWKGAAHVLKSLGIDKNA